ncbi:hypothetical protein PHLCEN_2v11434 [Hermanssonia centrifuga]|uniref:Yeast cell wall synthesis Kre9/Knh1-like N-terminal domain-containing protein n=1 Tax=Hermanssonia centrifuga TaxID=98765 RepID=A0A2R6NK40_9APHY|nr:hypothetical protein PHLCEN_2v11434 [Hermanssonia centrifuga]
MVSRRFAVSAFLGVLFSSAVADLQVLAPGGPNLWWGGYQGTSIKFGFIGDLQTSGPIVAQSANTIVWTCADSPFQSFTILIANSAISPVPEAIIASENNFDCSQTTTAAQQLNFPVGTGYTIQFANPLNNTDVYAESQQFEIKPLGSPFPPASATPVAAKRTFSERASLATLA